MNIETHQTNGKAARPNETGLRSLDVALIDPSPTQPRKTFTGIEEMAADIKLHGLLQPVLVRPHPKKAGRYELVFGERRLRGTKLAGLKSILATVRELSDAEVVEIQIVENAKRSDIHPLEEADAYHALATTHGYAVEEIAAKVGKSTATIYARLKFAALVPEARKAFLDGKLTAATALLIARIPHEDLQKKALKEITTEGYDGALPAFREAARIVQRNYMLRLVDAPFDRADASLVAGAPACQGCPKRTGNQRELFSDIEAKDDLCTDPKCFGAKRDATWERRVAEAKEKGQKVLSEKETKDVFPHGMRSVSGTSPYVDINEPDYSDPKQRTRKQLLGKAAKDVEIVLARDPDGGVRELVARSEFTKAAPKPKSAPPAKMTAAEKRREEEWEAEQKKRAREAKKREARLVEVVAKAERVVPGDTFWRLLALEIARAFDWDGIDLLARRKLLATDGSYDEREQRFRETVAKMKGNQARGLVVELLATFGPTGAGSDSRDATLDAFATFYGLGKAKKGGGR
jgi:ParB/RepB/Spo0J family partition protein